MNPVVNPASDLLLAWMEEVDGARGKGRHAQDAEDVFQEAFLRVWSNLSRIEPARIRACFRRARKWCRIDGYRRQGRRRRLLEALAEIHVEAWKRACDPRFKRKDEPLKVDWV